MASLPKRHQRMTCQDMDALARLLIALVSRQPYQHNARKWHRVRV